MKVYTVNMNSFSIDDETRKEIQSMTYAARREWIADKALDGSIHIVEIFEKEEVPV